MSAAPLPRASELTSGGPTILVAVAVNRRPPWISLFSGSVLAWVALGAVLRVWDLDGQYLLDDEWHALKYAALTPLFTSLAEFAFASNSIPLNAWAWLTLHTCGWSVWSLKLPILLGGVLMIPLVAWAFRGLLPDSALIAVTGLTAISPLSIYYSRIYRPYGPLMALTTLALLAGIRWLQSADRRWALVYTLASALAAWFHQLAPLAVGVPLGIAIVARLLPQRFAERCGLPSVPWREILLVLAGLILACLVLMGPAVWFSFSNFARAYGTAVSRYDVTAVSGCLLLQLGFGDWTWAVPAVLLGVLGYCWLVWRQPLLAWVLTTLSIVHLGFLYVKGAPDLYVPIVLTRYTVAILPFALVTVGTGLAITAERLSATLSQKYQRTATVAVISGVVLAAYNAGPWPTIFREGMQFQHLAHFQEDYRLAGAEWRTGPHRRELRIDYGVPNYYRELARRTDAVQVVEYPFLLGHSYSFAGYYQQIHHKRVLGGYLETPLPPPEFRARHIYTTSSLSEVVAVLPRPVRLNLENTCDILQLVPAREKETDLIVHRDPFRECGMGGDHSQHGTLEANPVIYQQLMDLLTRRYGPSIYQDDQITVFRIPRATD